jgi:hypothetical protein
LSANNVWSLDRNIRHKVLNPSLILRVPLDATHTLNESKLYQMAGLSGLCFGA